MGLTIAERKRREGLLARGFKHCPKCKMDKPLNQFGNSKSTKDGYWCYCRPCTASMASAYYRSKQGQAVIKRYRKSKRKRCVSRRYVRSKKGKQLAKKNREANPLKIKARRAISNLTRHDRFPAASTKKCFVCDKQAEEYHHFSYKKEYWFDVIPMCIKCHRRHDITPI